MMYRTSSDLSHIQRNIRRDLQTRDETWSEKRNGRVSSKPNNGKQFGLVHSISWPNFPPTLDKEEMPVTFRQPYVEKGFRALHQPWWYYFPLSIFQLHNETMNIWTHLLAIALLARRVYLANIEVNFKEDPYSWPLLAGFLCGAILYTCSIAAHSMQAKSEVVHYTAFMFDYAGIGIYGLGSFIMNLAYCSEDVFYNAVEVVFLPLGCIFAVMICVCSSMAKLHCMPHSYIRKTLQVVPVASQYLFAMSPLILRWYSCTFFGENCNESISYHIGQFILFVLSGFFFASDFPQRLWPGTCDHVFHSHQIFHLTIMMCTLVQYEGVYIDFKRCKSLVWHRPVPTLASTFVPVIIVAVADILCIVIIYRKIKC